MPGSVIDVDDVVEAAGARVPEARFERGVRAAADALPARVQAAGDAQGVQPERLDLDRLADPRRDRAAVDARVHPGELRARLAGRDQAVLATVDPVARALREAADDGEDGSLDARPLLGDVDERAARGREIRVGRDDVEERGVDRVVLGLGAAIGEAVRQEAVLHDAGPREQDVARVLEAAAAQAEAAQRDERVAAPVAEPRVAGDDGAPFAARDEVRIGRALEPALEVPAAALLFGAQTSHQRVDRLVHPLAGLGTVGGDRPLRLAAREVEAEHRGRAEILHRVQPALFLPRVEEAAIPFGRRVDFAVLRREDGRQVRVGLPTAERAEPLGVESERVVLAMQRVEVAPREERSNAERHAVGAPVHRPAQNRHRHPVDDEEILDQQPAGHLERPARPRLALERAQATVAVRMIDAGRVALRADREAPLGRLDPGLEAVDHHHPARGRIGRHTEERVIAPRPDERRGARGKPAEPVGLEPLTPSIDVDHARLLLRVSWQVARTAAGFAVLVRVGARRLRAHSPPGSGVAGRPRG